VGMPKSRLCLALRKASIPFGDMSSALLNGVPFSPNRASVDLFGPKILRETVADSPGHAFPVAKPYVSTLACGDMDRGRSGLKHDPQG